MTNDVAFKKQFEIGMTAEMRIRKIYEAAGYLVIGPLKGSKSDLIVTDGHLYGDLLEVKNEERYASSGNLCIETSQGDRNGNRKYSGIQQSQSTVCVHYFGDYCVIYRTVACRRHLARLVGCGRVRHKQFGDNKNEGIVISKHSLLIWNYCAEVATEDLPNSVRRRLGT